MVTTRLPSAGFSITIRIAVTADASSIGRLTTCVGEAGAIVTALDVVDSDPTRVLVDLTCDTADSSHADQDHPFQPQLAIFDLGDVGELGGQAGDPPQRLTLLQLEFTGGDVGFGKLCTQRVTSWHRSWHAPSRGASR